MVVPAHHHSFHQVVFVEVFVVRTKEYRLLWVFEFGKQIDARGELRHMERFFLLFNLYIVQFFGQLNDQFLAECGTRPFGAQATVLLFLVA